MSTRFTGQLALITGASSGIGLATARRFAAEGGLAMICGRNQEALEQTVADIRAAGGAADWIVADISDEAALTAAVHACEQRHGRLDVLVNNAATVVWGNITDTHTADWQRCLQGSLTSAFFSTRAALPIMQRQGAGAIVNVSSVCGCLGSAGMAAYSAAKAGLVSFTRVAALEAAPHNIRVNAVVPGVVLTPPTLATFADAAAQRASAAAVPIGRIGTPEELAAAILFLASSDASYITGTSLTVDGGKTCELNTRASHFN